VQIISVHNGLLHYKINQDDVSIDQLGIRLSSILSARADRVIFVKGNDNLDFAAVAKVLDIGRSAGANHIGLLTSQDPL